MIDWVNLAANSLWILGLALALAALSYASWQASLAREKLRTRLGQPGTQTVLNLAGVLFCAGLAASSVRMWEIVVWVVLAVLFLAQIVAAFYTAKHNKPISHRE
jgi:hypothetical protein